MPEVGQVVILLLSYGIAVNVMKFLFMDDKLCTYRVKMECFRSRYNE
jgi:hypothetical protein